MGLINFKHTVIPECFGTLRMLDIFLIVNLDNEQYSYYKTIFI